jgi:hypothetical protein
MSPQVKEGFYELLDYSQAQRLARLVLKLNPEQHPELIALANRVLSPRAQVHQKDAA